MKKTKLKGKSAQRTLIGKTGTAVSKRNLNGQSPKNDHVRVLDVLPPVGEHDADADIREGRVKTFDDSAALIASLKRPW